MPLSFYRNSHPPAVNLCNAQRCFYKIFQNSCTFFSCIAQSPYRNSNPPVHNAQRYFLQIFQNSCLIFFSRGIASSLHRNSHPLAICPLAQLIFILPELMSYISLWYRFATPSKLTSSCYITSFFKTGFQNLCLVMLWGYNNPASHFF
jgi:hypothetical protein